MKNISEQIWRKGISLLLVLCMICTLFGQYLPCIVAKAANETSYMVELNGTKDLLLSNATASNGPVTLTYTVESLTTTTGNNGVVATPSPLGSNPYSSGKLNYHNTANKILVEGRTYTLVLSVDDNGAVTQTSSWTDESAGTSGSSVYLPHSTGSGSTESQYFGIYVSGSTTAKLTNVTCVDSEGNDLGLQVNTKNSDKCTITTYTEVATSYTVELNGTKDLLLSNATASNGPIILTYTVESLTTTTGNNGVVATPSPLGSEPYSSGKLNYHNTANKMLVEGRTYTLELSVDDNGGVTQTCSWTDENAGTSGSSVYLPHNTGSGSTESQYFGIYVSGSTTAKLTNVTCVDSEGNDLGLQVNTKNVEKCVIRGIQKVMKVSDIRAYRGDVNSVPNTEKGYIFAGWYQDAVCKQAISADTISGEAYAKYVDETVLTIKAQISAQASTDSSSDIRFVTTVDSLDYSAIGFEVTANNKSKTYNTTTVYATLKYIDKDEVMQEYKPEEEFSPISQYFKACTIKGISSQNYGAEWNVKAYWITLDGTTVYGSPAVKTIAEGLSK